jgi:hypothetical protein
MPTNVRHEDVERRAYELFEQRGREEGRDWDDWLQAERELLASDRETRREDENIEPVPSVPRRKRAEREVEFG